jgi:hypothetical protein
MSCALTLSDVIPSVLRLVPGSVVASTGVLSVAANTLLWSGAPPVTITYATSVTAQTPTPVLNTVALLGGAGETLFSFGATVFVGGRVVYLPVVRRGSS